MGLGMEAWKDKIPDSKELKKAIRGYIKSFIKYGGHLNNEFQEAKNRKASEKVLDRNKKDVINRARELSEIIESETDLLEKKLDHLRAIKNYLRSVSISPQPYYVYSSLDPFPEIEKGIDEYQDRYLDRKWRRRS
jgi:uncharacterized protein YeaO (DUF488 family)